MSGPRHMEPGDYEKGHLQLLAQLSPFDVNAVSQEAYAGFAQSAAGRNAWVIEVSNRIVASGTLVVEPKLIHGLSAAGHIEDIVVAADYRGRGLGCAMIDHLVAEAKRCGCYKVILDCNEETVAFYAKCGFNRKGAAMALYF